MTRGRGGRLLACSSVVVAVAVYCVRRGMCLYGFTESGAELCAFPYMPIFATLRVEDLLISFVYEDLICRPMTIAL